MAVPTACRTEVPQPFTATVTVTGIVWYPGRLDRIKEKVTTGRLLQFAKQEGDPVSAGEAVAWVDDETTTWRCSRPRAPSRLPTRRWRGPA